MATSLLLEDGIEIPMGLRDLADFRRWALSDDFPETGRIDYVAGRIEVDMSPEDAHTHGSPKVEVSGALRNILASDDRGCLFVDSTRISSVLGDLSVEPDIVFISYESLESGRVRQIPKATLQEGRVVEFEGGVDLVVEVMSDSSVSKDTKRLPAAYFAAGVGEYWLIDARRKDLRFQIYFRGSKSFRPVSADSDGFQKSRVFSIHFRLTRWKGRLDIWKYRMETR